MKTKLPKEIRCISAAMMFLSELHRNCEAYHPEDDARQIESIQGRNLFTYEEAIKLNELMNQIHDLYNFDPCEYLLSLEYKTMAELQEESGGLRAIDLNRLVKVQNVFGLPVKYTIESDLAEINIHLN